LIHYYLLLKDVKTDHVHRVASGTQSRNRFRKPGFVQRIAEVEHSATRPNVGALKQRLTRIRLEETLVELNTRCSWVSLKLKVDGWSRKDFQSKEGLTSVG
jgi:hypothetical protein